MLQQGSPERSRGAQHKRFWSLIVLLAIFATPAAAQQPDTHTRAIAAGYKALTLCEGVLSAGRSEAQVAAVELKGIYPQYDAIVPTLDATIDRRAQSVSVTFDTGLPPRLAQRRARTGCVLAPIGDARAPDPAFAAPPAAAADPRPWPMGDRGIAPKSSPALAGMVAKAFDGTSYGAGVTTGVVIVRDGRIVAERYADGFGPLVPNRTWSVAKSIAGTLVGMAAHDLKLDPQKSAPIPEWSAPGDPRQAITLDQLLRMASGLHSGSAGNRTDALYFGGATVPESAAQWPIEARPGTRFRYSNNDTVLAVRAIRAAMQDDARYAAWPNARLFAPLGMAHTTTGTDWQGHFILSSQVWSTARDFARLGQFWLDDGVWQGKRLLPSGWMRYMTTPSGPQPADGPGYGATLWLFGPKQGLPAGSYAAQGNRGQYIMVIPSKRLIVVRRGEDPAGARFDIARFAAEVTAATR